MPKAAKKASAKKLPAISGKKPRPHWRKGWVKGEKAWDDGLNVRRAMFGPAGAENQIADTTDFMWPLQDYVTRKCFGETWTRPTLNRKTRSLITLGMLVAMGRPHEIAVHVRGAINNGVSKEELSELMLHAIIYCGLPKAVEGFRTAQGVLKDMGLE
jgi:4-carboxymuconolactone decarboxylase